jgi:hypothetical protein
VEESVAARRRWTQGAEPGRSGDSLLGLSDDELLFHIASLDATHAMDEALLEVVRSDRHFYIRQEAAKKIRDPGRLRDHSGDRHIGQILVRSMNRSEDIVYLEKLRAESRHIEVRKAAEAQLRIIERARGVG